MDLSTEAVCTNLEEKRDKKVREIKAGIMFHIVISQDL